MYLTFMGPCIVRIF